MKLNSNDCFTVTKVQNNLIVIVLFTIVSLISQNVSQAAPVWQDDSAEQQSDSPMPGEMQAMVLTAKAFRVASKRIEPSLVSIESFGGVGAKQGRIGGIRKQAKATQQALLFHPTVIS